MIDYDSLIRLHDLQVRLFAIRPFNDERINLRRIADTKVLFRRSLRYEVAAYRYLPQLCDVSDGSVNSCSCSRSVGR